MNTMSIVRLIQKAANRFGVDIREYNPARAGYGQLAMMLACHNVDLVFDIGANTGQFAKSLRAAGYKKRLVSFEPLSTAHRQLLRASHNDPQWDIAPRGAIGDHEGEVKMHIAGNSVSSSVLDMLKSHESAAPHSAYVGTESTPISRLDTIVGNYLGTASAPFLKIDTQGYEDRVLDGANALLAKAKGLHMELSFVPLYADQKLFDELVERLRPLGFSIWAITPGFCDPHTGRMLQVDATFFRDEA